MAFATRGLYDRVLLTIGNDNYHPCQQQTCPLQPLKGAVNDSRCMRDQCQSAGWLVFAAQDLRTPELFRHHALQASLGITKATSVVTFHYSGHAEDKQGQIWLIPCSENHDCSKECAKPPCSEHHDCLKCENCARIPCSKDCSKDCAKVSLLVILEQLCERAHKEAKLIVLFDGCRTDGQPVSDPIVQRGTLANRKYLLLFACGRSRQAQEYLNPDGSHSGLFTLAFLMSVQACDELQSLWSTTQTTLKRLGRRGVMQDLQFMGNLPCFASEPNVFQNYRFAGLTQELKEMQATVLRVSQDRDHFKTKYEVEKEKLRRFEEQIVRLTTEKEELQSQCQDLDFKLRSLEVGQSSQSAAHLKLVELLKIYKGKLSEVNQKLENTNAEMKKKASECKYIKEQLEEKEIEFQKVSKKCAELQKQVDNYQHDNLSQSTDLQCFQMDRDLQKEHISQLKSQLQEYRKEKLQHQSEISELKREYTAKSVAMREIQKQNSVLQFQLREIQKQKNHPEFQNITRGIHWIDRDLLQERCYLQHPEGPVGVSSSGKPYP
ncbi:unnamed protein product [Durusdinium trenchii]|uniref:Uncharacterized protein n=1 Tax=Durusdinium trenchii TaxID=1381693 RepID=A0ABP0RT33_9DINO